MTAYFLVLLVFTAASLKGVYSVTLCDDTTIVKIKNRKGTPCEINLSGALLEYNSGMDFTLLAITKQELPDGIVCVTGSQNIDKTGKGTGTVRPHYKNGTIGERIYPQEQKEGYILEIDGKLRVRIYKILQLADAYIYYRCIEKDQNLPAPTQTPAPMGAVWTGCTKVGDKAFEDDLRNKAQACFNYLNIYDFKSLEPCSDCKK